VKRVKVRRVMVMVMAIWVGKVRAMMEAVKVQVQVRLPVMHCHLLSLVRWSGRE
jgi:hypothetical protein